MNSIDLLLIAELCLVGMSSFAAGYFWAQHRLQAYFLRRIALIRRRELIRARQLASKMSAHDIIDSEVIE